MKRALFLSVTIIALIFMFGCSSIPTKALYPIKWTNQSIVNLSDGLYGVRESSEAESIGASMIVVQDTTFLALSFLNLSSTHSSEADIIGIQLKDADLTLYPKINPEIVLDQFTATYNKYASTPISAPVMETHSYSYSSGYANAYGSTNTYGSSTYGHVTAYGSSATNTYATQNETLGSSLSRGFEEGSRAAGMKAAQGYLNIIATQSFTGNVFIPPQTRVNGFVYFPVTSKIYPLKLTVYYADTLYTFYFSDTKDY